MIYNVYLICSEFEGRRLYKIGYTRRPIEKRIKEIKTGNGSDIYLVDSFKSKWGTKIESQLHRFFKSRKVNGEWFDLRDEDINSFLERCKSTHDMLELITTNNTYYLETGRLF
jgi:hypothetical protein